MQVQLEIIQQEFLLILRGLDPSLWDLDGTGFDVYTNTNMALVNRMSVYFINYINGGNYNYPDASTLVSQTPTATSATTKHAIAIDFLAERDPQYTVPTNVVDEYERPYFSLHYLSNNSKVNLFDNFVRYGSEQRCTTSQSDWINNVQVGAFNATENYRIISKDTSTDTNGNITYFVTIVTPGNGRASFIPFGSNPTLTPINSAPVFDASSEYGVFDSNSSNTFLIC